MFCPAHEAALRPLRFVNSGGTGSIEFSASGRPASTRSPPTAAKTKPSA